MKPFLFRVFALVLFAAIIISCSKDDDPKPLTKDEAVTALNQSSEQMALTMNEIMETQGMQTLATLSGLLPNEIYSLKNNVVKDAFQSIILEPSAAKPIIIQTDVKAEFDTPFGNFGTHTWDHQAKTWISSNEPVDQVVYHFPSDTMQVANNSSLTLSNIAVENIDEQEVITSLGANLDVNNQGVMLLGYNVTTSQNQIQGIAISLNFTPFQFESTLIFQYQTNDILIKFTHTLKKASVSVMSSNLEILFNGDNFDFIPVKSEVDVEFEPSSVYGYLQLGQMKATIDLNVELYYQATGNEPSVDKIESGANKYLKINLVTFPSGVSIASVKWYYLPEMLDIIPYLVFSDGSELPASDFMPEGFDLNFF